MANALAKNLHLSPRTGAYQKCVAEKSCPYFVEQGGKATHSDAHFSLAELAVAGGALVRIDGRTKTYTVSQAVDGHFTVGIPGSRRVTTYTLNGARLNGKQAEIYRKSIKSAKCAGS